MLQAISYEGSLARKFFILFFLILFASTAYAQDIPPQWVKQHWEIMTRDDGIWIANNADYQSNSEPYEAYGIKWEWGFAKKSIKGRLYGIKDGKNVGTFWEFHSVWHPGDKIVKEYQFGSDGTLGIGKLVQTRENTTEHTMQFFTPDGSTYQTGHRIVMKNWERHSRSYRITDSGEWKEQRFYIWKQKEKSTK